MKGIGPNNLGMSKTTGSECCGIPNCGCGDMPEAPGKMNPGFKSLPMDVQKKIAPEAAGKKRNCSYK